MNNLKKMKRLRRLSKKLIPPTHPHTPHHTPTPPHKTTNVLTPSTLHRGAGGAGGGQEDDEGEEEKGFDAYDLADPVDVLAKLSETWFTGLV